MQDAGCFDCGLSSQSVGCLRLAIQLGLFRFLSCGHLLHSAGKNLAGSQTSRNGLTDSWKRWLTIPKMVPMPKAVKNGTRNQSRRKGGISE